MTQVEDFSDIDGLNETGIEFLVAAGVEDLQTLAKSDADSLYHEMKQANQLLNIHEDLPSVAEIEGWIQRAAESFEVVESAEVVKLAPEDEVIVPEILEAIPVSARLIVEQKISVKDVPVMELFLEEEAIEALQNGDVDGGRRSVEVRDRTVSTPTRVEKKSVSEVGIPGQVTVIERKVVDPLPKAPGRDIRKTASAELNEGKKLHSRRYVRGVLHPQPFRVRLAALISMITLILLPASFVGGGLVLAHFSIWYVAIPIASIVFGILYFLYARGLRCRICGQPLFAPKACRRHVKAHHIPVLGYILPTCIQLLLFHWFRCMYCGTSIRIKE